MTMYPSLHLVHYHSTSNLHTSANFYQFFIWYYSSSKVWWPNLLISITMKLTGPSIVSLIYQTVHIKISMLAHNNHMRAGYPNQLRFLAITRAVRFRQLWVILSALFIQNCNSVLKQSIFSTLDPLTKHLKI
jgi:hypothetical protein